MHLPPHTSSLLHRVALGVDVNVHECRDMVIQKGSTNGPISWNEGPRGTVLYAVISLEVVGIGQHSTVKRALPILPSVLLPVSRGITPCKHTQYDHHTHPIVKAHVSVTYLCVCTSQQDCMTSNIGCKRIPCQEVEERRLSKEHTCTCTCTQIYTCT